MIITKTLYYVYAIYEGKWIYSLNGYGFTTDLNSIKFIDKKSSAKMRVTNMKNTNGSRYLTNPNKSYIGIPIKDIADSIKIAEFNIDIPDPSICF